MALTDKTKKDLEKMKEYFDGKDPSFTNLEIYINVASGLFISLILLG